MILNNFFRRYRKGIFFVVYKIDKRKIKYLLLKRKLHWKGWEFPKGGKEKDERDLETIKRELKEETGLKPIEIKKYFKKGKYNYDKKSEKERGLKGQKFKLYSVKVKEKKVKIDKKEHSSYKWVDFKTAEKMLTWENQKECLRIVNNQIFRQLQQD